MTGSPSSLWLKARFLAVRQELVDSLGPRNAAELPLIDRMAAAQWQLFTWQQTLTIYASIASLGSKDMIRERGAPNPPRVTVLEAVGPAAGMVERFERLFHRALAAFQAQRRQAPLVVRRAGHVNVAQNQQINMMG